MQSVRVRPVQVYLIAPPMVSWGLERLVQTAHPLMELTGSTDSFEAAEVSMEKHPADVVVAHLESDAGGGIDRLVELQKQVGGHMLLVTGSHDTAMLDKAVLAGVRGIVKTNDPPAILLKAIEKVNDGELWIDRGATSRIFLEMARQKAAQGNDPEKTKIATLTSRERQTIAAVASDASAPGKVIANRLCISEHTLRNHLTSIYGKLGLSSRLDLYAYATKHSLTKPL